MALTPNVTPIGVGGNREHGSADRLGDDHILGAVEPLRLVPCISCDKIPEIDVLLGHFLPLKDDIPVDGIKSASALIEDVAA